MYENDPHSPRTGYGLHNDEDRLITGKGWLWIGGAAVLVVLLLALLGVGGSETGSDGSSTPAVEAPAEPVPPVPAGN